jgi:hypothetical protein
LLGNEKGSDEGSDVDVDPTATMVSQEDLRQIVRRNAFGPDFRTFDYIERRWRQDVATATASTDNANDAESTSASASTGDSLFTPTRLLGMYPLAAMLNHSCVPNAVRVFSGETMLAHANANIKAGQEIVWSYLPPTQPYPVRSETLKNRYGFECTCERCVVEQAAWKGPFAELLQESYESVSSLNQLNLEISLKNQGSADSLQSAIQKLQGDILENTNFSNELRRYMRVGYMHLYINFLNAALASVPVSPDDATAMKERLLNTCMELHFAFCSCHNASTEHLSVRATCNVKHELVPMLVYDV